MKNPLYLLHDEMRLWRRYLHQHPETAFEEISTAQFIADKLTSFGLDVNSGLGKTGVVATLSAGSSDRKIALRADMDALFIDELNTFAHKSSVPGKMHACGHDGHCAMLLGAACHLARQPNFDGTVYFIFQPAEEGRAGAKQMIEDGLFNLFPADSVFGLHNFPDIPVGHFAVMPGPMMASFDCFEITLTGIGSHAAMPHQGADTIIASAQLINALQTIVSRNIDPQDPAVISITQIHAGNTWNSIPESAVIRGTFRCFSPNVQSAVSKKITQLTHAVCAGFNVSADIKFNPENAGYPVTLNSETETNDAFKAALAVAGENAVHTQLPPSMGSEDFAFMLQEKPGCYSWIGNGPAENSCMLHNPHYDFNDDILPIGAAFWVKLVKTKLSPA